ncbi:hypothetical protein GCM10023156_29270 [Novipirellula rosea]|uniref:Tyr recombinase domain-containing protein n=1 Tax=Novipirellula rosea TaxID=1031540 RepID=A0ABP8MVY5_9BACT
MVADLNPKTVPDWLQWLLDNTELAAATVEKDRTHICALWTFAAKKGWLAEFPDIRPIPCPERVPDAWTDDELLRLFRACQSARGRIGKVKANQYWPALLSVIYDTGERIGAVLEIRRDDIDAQGWLTVRGEHRKGKTRDKRFKLRPETIERVEAIRVFAQERVFEWPYSDGYLWTKFGKILEAAGLPNNRRSKLHKIRRTTASNFEAAGGNATALLDHQHRRTTKRYLDPRVVKETQPADILPGIGELAKAILDGNENNDRMVSEFRAFLEAKQARNQSDRN